MNIFNVGKLAPGDIFQLTEILTKHIYHAKKSYLYVAIMVNMKNVT